MNAPSRIVIAGGGYAGIRAAYDLASVARQKNLEVIIITPSRLQIEVPSLYEVATVYLEHESTHSSEYACSGIGASLDTIFQGLPITMLYTNIQQILASERLLILEDKQTISFDHLLLSVGTDLATFHIPGVTEYSYNVKTLHDALRLRHHIMHQLFRARTMNVEDQRQALTFVVVGGGSAGVEIASELAGLLKRVCAVRGIRPDIPTILLLEAGPQILKELPPQAQKKALERLQALRVKVMVNHAVSTIEEQHVVLTSGIHLATSTVIWSGGLATHPLLVRSGLPIEKWGVPVEPTLQVRGYPGIFAAGDCAVITTNPLPGIAPVAAQEGAFVAQNILRAVAKQPLQSFHYNNQGHYITVGGRYALALLYNRFLITGWLAWVLKKLVALRYWSRLLSWPAAVQLWWQGVRVQAKND